MDEREQKAISDIEKYGCHILHVLEEGEDPPFSYSVGIWKSSGAPELVVVGLKRELAHFIINEYNRRVKEGHRFQLGERASDFIEGFECQNWGGTRFSLSGAVWVEPLVLPWKQL